MICKDHSELAMIPGSKWSFKVYTSSTTICYAENASSMQMRDFDVITLFRHSLAPDCKPAPILAEHTVWEI